MCIVIHIVSPKWITIQDNQIIATFANVAMEAQRRELSQIEANTKQYIVSLVEERLTELC